MPVTPDLAAALLPEFERNFRERNELGASVSIFHQGIEILHLSHGIANPADQTPWTAATLVPVWSATKGPAAVACLLALEDAGLWLDDRVTKAWPEFGNAGKTAITFRQLLSHNAGLSALDQPVPIDDFDAVIHALEHQAPNHPPGTQQAYHARTFGFLLDKIVRNLSAQPTLGHYFRQKIGEPMNLDFWIGVPPSEQPRIATLQPAKIKAGTKPDAFMQAFTQPGSLTQRTFASPTGMGSVRDLNRPEIIQQGFASFGGAGSARGLAAFYGMLANGGQWNGNPLVSPRLLETLETPLSQQTDAVLHSPIAFSAGLMLNALENGRPLRSSPLFSQSPRAYGHPGAGGSLAFADPARRLSFAYVMNQMETGALPNQKSLSLVQALDQTW